MLVAPSVFLHLREMSDLVPASIKSRPEPILVHARQTVPTTKVDGSATDRRLRYRAVGAAAAAAAAAATTSARRAAARGRWWWRSQPFKTRTMQ